MVRMAPRAPQPRCSNPYPVKDGSKTCNHPMSFHSPAMEGKCTALGCGCTGFVLAPEPEAESV